MHTLDEMQSTQPNITHNHILPTKHNIQSHHISDEMQSIKHNTHSHLHIKMHEQWSYFVLDIHFIQDAHSKRPLRVLDFFFFLILTRPQTPENDAK